MIGNVVPHVYIFLGFVLVLKKKKILLVVLTVQQLILFTYCFPYFILCSVITFRDMLSRWRSFIFLLAVSIIMFIIGYNRIHSPYSGRLSKSGLNSTLFYQNGDILQNKNQFIQTSQQSFSQPIVLASIIWEQTGMALRNLFNLQCWASSVNISQVIEPFICSDSVLAFRFGCRSDFNFRDFYDIDYWNQVSLRRNHSILVSSSYLQNASKEVIYVQLKYIENHSWFKCYSLDELANQHWFKFFKRNGCNISTVCIKFPISDSDFQKKIFGSTDASQRNKTVIFEEWRGFKSSRHDRVELTGTRCGKSPDSSDLVFTRPPAIEYPPFRLSPLLPSKQVLGCIDRFLSEHMHGEQYVVVMIRSEKLKPNLFHSPKFEDCMEGITSDYKKALDRMNGTRTLIFTDSGKYGSHSMRRNKVDRYSQYLLDHLDPELSLEQMDSALQDITRSKDSALMAFFQSGLAARANCVLFLGAGSFQRLTLGMFANNHRGHECYYFRNEDCTPQYIKTVY